MKREELREALRALGMSQVAFAAVVSRVSGLRVQATHINRMCSRSDTGRDPSPVVQAVAVLLLERQRLDRLEQSLKRAGYTHGG